MNTKLKNFFSLKTVLILFFAACLICIFPFSRDFLISIAEKILHRSLQDLTKWNAVIIYSCTFFATSTVIAYFLLYFKKGNEISETIKEKTISIFTKQNLIRVAVLFGIYILSYLTLLKADFDYQDDVKRIIAGHKSWVGASRYVSEILSVFLHSNFYLNDIAPVPQLLAMLILAFSSLVLCYIVNDGKITKISLLASTLMGICPFYFENMAYKFDSPYMAIAMLFAILPFLFREEKITYASTSVISLLVVLTSYQAGNSIYIILAIYLALQMILSKKSGKEIRNFILISIGSYIAALVLFRLIIMIPTEATISERDTTTGGLQIFEIIKTNFTGYFHFIFTRYGNLWIKIFTLISIILFPVNFVKNHPECRIKALLLSLASLFLMTALSFGAYLIIGNTVIHDRAFMGFDVLIAVIVLSNLNIESKGKKYKVFAGIVSTALFWGFFINSTVTGNLLIKQQEYTNFRYTILLDDLSEIINPEEENKTLIIGGTGPATSTNMGYKNYTLENYGRINDGWTQYLVQYWNMDLDFLEIESYDDLKETKPDSWNLVKDLPVIKDTYYHRISGADGKYLIELKNPQVKEYEIQVK